MTRALRTLVSLVRRCVVDVWCSATVQRANWRFGLDGASTNTKNADACPELLK